jgi:hypothetical protein
MMLLEHSVRLSGLAPGVTYHFRVRSTDASGHQAEPGADYTFTTIPTAKKTPPRTLKVDEALPLWLPLLAIALAIVAAAAIYIGSRARTGRRGQ